jgi:hypothetical protein
MPVTIVGNNTPTAGGVVYGDGTNYVSSSAGTSGQPLVSGGTGAPAFRPYTLPASDGSASQVLQTNGAGVLSFATPSSGAVVLLSTVNIANTRVHNFTGLSGYFNYQLYVTAISAGLITASSVTIQVGTGTATTSSYYWGGVNSNGTSLTGSEQDAGTAFYPFGNVQDLSNSYSIQISANIFTAASQNPTFQCRANGYGNANNTQTATMSGVNLSLTSMSSIHLDLGSTNLTGSIYLVGVKNA